MSSPGIGLRWRIAILSAMVAVLSVSMCGIVAVRVVRSGLAEQREQSRQAALVSLDVQMEALIERLSYEVDDYARWTELYDQLPQPDTAWARINLTPGSPGSLARVFVLVANGAVQGRYRGEQVSTHGPSIADPATDATYIQLAQAESREGIAQFFGSPALVAVRSIRTSDGNSQSDARLIGVSYMTPDILNKIHLSGWTCRMVVDTGAEQPQGDLARSEISYPGLDQGRILFRLAAVDNPGSGIAVRANDAIALGGLICVIIASTIGMLLGMQWLAPLSAVAEAARRRVLEPDTPLPDAKGLREAVDMCEALEAYSESESRHREALATALDRESVANSMHRRFLAQLGHEIGPPLERIALILADMQKGIQVEPETLARVAEDALHLEERIHEGLGLAAEIHSADQGGHMPREFSEYAHAVANLVEPLCRRHQREVVVDADAGSAAIPVALLTPILINVLANAIKAPGRGPVILSVRDMPDGSLIWRVSDPGPGIADDLAAVIRDACVRGEVVPGAPGMGLGMAVIITNARALKATVTLERTGPSGTTIAITMPAGELGIDYRKVSSGTARFRRRHAM